MVDLKSYYPSPAYQLGLLVAYAKLDDEVRKQADFVFTEHAREQSAEDIVQSFLSAGADLVAMSNYAWNYKKICEILEILSKTNGHVPRVLLGGPNSAGEFGSDMMRAYPNITAMVEGEGEPAFRDICVSLVRHPEKDPFVGSRNCVTRAEDGSLVRPTELHRIKQLDEIPSPYLEGILPVDPSPLFYETNRGCPYRCSFCYWGNGNPKIYRMSLDRVREEMEFFAKNKVRAFWIADANFGIFPTDAEIAEMMSEINARYGFPFTHVGVNWAKNSSDRVIEIASVLRQGRMSTSMTLAIQSVTPQAEKKSRRYSMVPSKFVSLIRTAEEKEIDTYTDLIWGLPGETIDDFLDGLDTVIHTGVPCIHIHQLALLPGTEFFERRDEFGFTLLSETGEICAAPGDRSEYAEYTVVSHHEMSVEDRIRGTRYLGITHLLHNHNLGQMGSFYLERYGVTQRDVYSFFDDALTGRVTGLPGEQDGYFAEVRKQIVHFAEGAGLDETIFYRALSQATWFKEDADGRLQPNAEAVTAFLRTFFAAFCERHGICTSADERGILAALVTYNVLVSPKPMWNPEPSYSFAWDVHAMWLDMRRCILQAAPERVPVHSGDSRDNQPWQELGPSVRSRLMELLSDDYLEAMQRSVSYRCVNHWRIPPSRKNIDWVLTTRSKNCVIEVVDESETVV